MPRGPQRGLAGWGLILLLTTPLIIERAPSLAIQLFFFAHQTYGTMTSLSIPSTSSGSSISLSKLASTAFALFEHYIGAMVLLIYQTYSCHSLPVVHPLDRLVPTILLAKMEMNTIFFIMSHRSCLPTTCDKHEHKPLSSPPTTNQI